MKRRGFARSDGSRRGAPGAAARGLIPPDPACLSAVCFSEYGDYERGAAIVGGRGLGGWRRGSRHV